MQGLNFKSNPTAKPTAGMWEGGRGENVGGKREEMVENTCVLLFSENKMEIKD